MRVLHYVKKFSQLSETFVYDYIVNLEERGFNNHVLTHVRENEEERPFGKVSVVQRPGKWNMERLVRRAFKFHEIEPVTAGWTQIRRELKKRVRQINPDVIHAQFGPIGVLMAPVAKELDVPLVVTFHGYDVSRLIQHDSWIKIYNRSFEDISAFIGVSNHICDKVRKLGAPDKKICLVHNGIDIEKFSPAPKEVRKDPDIFRFCFIGRFVEKKSPLLLLKSYQEFLRLHDPGKVELMMIGDGPLLPEAQQFVTSKKLDHAVTFIGAVSHEEISRYLENSDVYVQHSVTASNGDEEGMGVSLAEASASGKPVITTNHNGFPDVVKDGKTGYLVEEKDWQAMGEKMGLLYGDAALRKELGENSRKHMEEHFDMNRQIVKNIEVLKKVTE